MNKTIGKEEIASILNCVRSKHISQGALVKRFEEAFSKYIGIKYACAVNNGTSALHIALVALGIKDGDEVIVPNLTFIATVNAVKYTGAKPIFVDVDETYCIDVKKISKSITKRTKAIIPVHLYGNVADMDKITKTAKKHNLYVVEDCAEAHGARYKGKMIGNFSTISCFSFYENKIITTGEGGMCLTNDKKLKEIICLLRSQGKPKLSELKSGKEFSQLQYYHHILAFNYRMTDMQAAIGLPQLKKIDKYLIARKKIANFYGKSLKNLSSYEKPIIKDYAKHVFWFYPVLISSSQQQIKIMSNAYKHGILLRSFFYPCNKQPFYFNKQNNNQNLEMSLSYNKRGILLPTDINLQEARKIVNLLKTY